MTPALSTSPEQNDLQKFIKAWGAHSSSTESVAELAAIAHVPETVAIEAVKNPIVLADLEAEAVRADADGRTTDVLARKTMRNVMQAAYEASKKPDVTDLPELAKIASRAIEQFDRVRLAEKQTENLPLIQINFGSDFSINTEVIKPAKPNSAIDIEARPVTPPDPSTHDLVEIETFNFKVTPIHFDGGDL